MPAARHEYPTEADLLEDYFERGWTDGLPIVPPTPDAVAAFVTAAGLAPDDVVGRVPTREVVVTAEHVAINAVMAGCKAEYMPLVVAAVRAHLHEKGNCHSTTGTLSGAAHVVIVNGPLGRELGVEAGPACFGPGFRANATIGRALRLVIRNVCRAVPGFLDRASFSWPLRYSFCFAEDELAQPTWTPLHVQRGFAPDDSTATVASVMRMVSALDFASRDPEGVLETIIHTVRETGFRGDEFLGDRVSIVLVMGPEHRRFFNDAGWTKEQIQAALLPRLNAPATGPYDRAFNVQHAEEILVVAAGGPGMGETWVLSPHLSWAITERAVVPARAS